MLPLVPIQSTFPKALPKKKTQVPSTGVKNIEHTTVQEEPEEETKIVIKDIYLEQSIGACISVYKCHYLKYGETNYLITGKKGVAIFNGKEVSYKLQAEFKVAASIFSNDGKYIIIMGEDGKFRYMQWT